MYSEKVGVKPYTVLLCAPPLHFSVLYKDFHNCWFWTYDWQQVTLPKSIVYIH